MESKFTKFIIYCLFSLVFYNASSAQDFMMQGWYWDYPKTNWAGTLNTKVSDLSSSGFTYVWVPPASRANSGSNSNGYDPKDLYDLGEFGLGATGFGTRPALDNLISACNAAGINVVADVVYNHRDGGKPENNSAVKYYINNYNYYAGANPYPYDRYRIILPLGGSTGNGAGDYYFKVSSESQSNNFKNWNYKIYFQTKTVGWQNLPNNTESEPNGGGDCSQSNNTVNLGIDMYASIDDPASCSIDEFHLHLNSSDFNSAGDTLFIYFGNLTSGYSDMRIYGLWSGPRSANIVNELVYQTYTDFTSMPSGQGLMNFENFKPNNTNSTMLNGDWDWMWFFYDYDQNVNDTKTKLQDWSRWLWDDVGFRGYRMDAVKHFPPEFVGGLLNNLHTNGIDPGMVVGEYYDANSSSLSSWVNAVSASKGASTSNVRAFDFALRDVLEKACDSYGYDVRNIFNSGIVDSGSGLNGYNAVTFINNHDFRDAGQPVDNDPILAYAYILTNNQVGLPCVFYPDYYATSGFSNSGMKDKIDKLINVHKNYIYGSSARDYLTKIGTTFNPYFNTGYANTTLVYQMRNTVSGKDVIVAINFAGEPLDMWVGVNTSSLPENTKLGDQIGNASLPTMTVSGGRINVKLPSRSYAVWVENTTAVCNTDNWTALPSSSSAATSAGYCTDGTGWSHYIDNSNHLLLSLKLGTSGAVVPTVTVDPAGSTDAVWYSNEADGFPNASSPATGAAFMKRKWDATATTQPSTDVNVRFYYTLNEFNAINTVLTNYGQIPLLLQTQMQFYKVLNGTDPFSIGPLALSNVQIISNGSSPTTSTWVHGSYKSDYYAEFKVAGFSGGSGAGSSSSLVLPISYLDVNAYNEGKYNIVSWVVSQIHSKTSFIVEKSIDGNDWTEIDRIFSENIKSEKRFSVIDKLPEIIVYYRIKALEENGLYTYTKTVSVKLGADNFKLISVSPNPNDGNFDIDFTTNAISNVKCTLYNSLGMEVKEVFIKSTYGKNRISIEEDELPSGIYTLSLQIDDKIETHKLSIKR